jgi:hypothetical protein
MKSKGLKFFAKSHNLLYFHDKKTGSPITFSKGLSKKDIDDKLKARREKFDIKPKNDIDKENDKKDNNKGTDPNDNISLIDFLWEPD